jgi:hypothetical protein
VIDVVFRVAVKDISGLEQVGDGVLGELDMRDQVMGLAGPPV